MGKNMFDMEVTGIDEVIQALQEFEGAIDQEVETALMSSALLVENAAKPLAAYESGTLRRSITHEIQGGDAIVGPSAEVPYAARIEFGFSGADSLGRVYNQAAQPYMRPALVNNRQAVTQEFSSSILALIGR